MIIFQIGFDKRYKLKATDAVAEIANEPKTFLKIVKGSLKTTRSSFQKTKAEEIISVSIAFPKMITRPGPVEK